MRLAIKAGTGLAEVVAEESRRAGGYGEDGEDDAQTQRRRPRTREPIHDRVLADEHGAVRFLERDVLWRG